MEFGLLAAGPGAVDGAGARSNGCRLMEEAIDAWA